MKNPLLKNLQLTNLKQVEEMQIKNQQLNNIQNNKELVKTLGSMTIDDKVEAYTNVRDKVFFNRNTPTMTLDEFADKQIVMMEEDKRMQAQFEKENKIEYEDEDLEKHVDNQNRADREWDDWKDLNEKGSGNKGYNR